MAELLLRHIAQIATPIGEKAIHGTDMNKLTTIEDGAIYIKDGLISKVGFDSIVGTETIQNNPNIEVIDVSGKCVIPGFVDPHTHFLFDGSRVEEFSERLNGTPYLELLKRGGGINSTVKSTRDASYEKLYSKGKETLNKIEKFGVTTIEGKSGYCLDFDGELKLLKVMKALDENMDITIERTYLGAHAIPPEYKENPDDYVAFIDEKVLPVIKKENLAKFVDVFCETGVFSNEQTESILKKATNLGFDLKLHADEMNSTGGAGLAVKMKAISADHLLAICDEDIASMADSDTIAVLLPATAFSMRKEFAPALKMIEKGCAIALASDYNPGSCNTYSIPLVLSLAVMGMGMSIEAALTAITLNSSAALGLSDKTGSIEEGKTADILILSESDYRYLVYDTGINIVDHVIKKGNLLW